MTADMPKRMTHSDAKRAAESVVAELRTRAQLADEMRRVPQENVDLLKRTGLLQTLQPASCRGQQLSLRAHVDVVSTVAKACNATGWVCGVYHAHSWLMGHMSPQAQNDVYGNNGNEAIAAVIGPRGKAVRKADGSYTLSGFWPFASGNAAADWLFLGSEIFDEKGNKLDDGDLLVPKKDIEVLDDWFVAGLQGTGSSSVKCANVTVPAHRFLSLSALLENQTAPYNDPNAPALYKSQSGPVLGLCIASGATGVARGALEEFLKVVPGKRIMYTGHLSHEWQPLQRTLGEAAAKINAAELVIYKVADDIDDFASRGEKMPMEMRARIRMDITLVPRMCRDAIQDLLTIGGAAGLSLKSPIQRAARNLQATCMHGLLLQEAGAEIYGRVLLGMDPGTPVI